MGNITDGVKGLGVGVFLILAGSLWMLPHAYQTDFLGDTYFYPVYYYLGWASLIMGGLGILAGIGFIIVGIVSKKETKIKVENADS